VALLAPALPLGGTAAAAPADSKADVDRRLQRADERLRAARSREEVLTQDVARFSTGIRGAEVRLAPLQARLDRLEERLGRVRARLTEVTTRLAGARERLQAVRDLLAHRRVLLTERLRAIYRRGQPDVVLLVLTSGSLSEVLQVADQLDRAVTADHDLVEEVKRREAEVREVRDRIARLRREVVRSERLARHTTAVARVAADRVRVHRDRLGRLRDGRQRLLSLVRHDRHEIEAEAADLRRQSAELSRRIVAASVPGVPTGAPSAYGFAWPVHGVLTSGFGSRWGRMHEGIDIAAGTGTPVGASAPGTVILAGWQGGYGNLVVVDHGNGLSTAYAHLSSIGVGVGQGVGQGSVVGAVGSTGNSTGPHLHFEVRAGGGAVNPLGYL
jgi:murein DD-endopeptidase MepM/ murein hydrolase activator NlpD